MLVVLIAGIGLLLGGLLAIGYGIPINEFGFGNTLIVAGTVSACTGLIMLALWIVVRELKSIARGLGSGIPAELHGDAALMAATAGTAPRIPDAATENAGDGEAATSPSLASPAPWLEETASRDRARNDGEATPESAERTGGQTAAQSPVLFLVAQGTRACPDAHRTVSGAGFRADRSAAGGRTSRAAAGEF